MTDLSKAIAVAKREGAREEFKRIDAILQYSFRRNGCPCEACNATALALCTEPMWGGRWCSFEAAKLILDNTVRGGCGDA
jgi:hypothetical protein